MARAGQFRDRVTFQQSVETPDGGGGVALVWQTVAVVWGRYMPQRGRERVAAGRMEASVEGVLHVRGSPETRAITAAHRVLIGGASYNIRSVANPDRRGQIIEMTVEEGVAV